MKILFVVGAFPKISETFILNQITTLIDRGHTVRILARYNTFETKVHPDIIKYNLLEKTIFLSSFEKTKRLKTALTHIAPLIKKNPKAVLRSFNYVKYKKDAFSLLLLSSLIEIKDKQEFDIIHAHFGDNGLLAIKLRELDLIKGKLYTTFHGYDLTGYLIKNTNNVYRDLFLKGDYFLPISNFWEKKLVSLGCESHKIAVHRMGVDVEKFEFEHSPISGKPLKVITIARLVEKKGIKFSIKAISELIKNNYDIEYSIIGDGPLREDLQKLIIDNQATSRIKLLGWKEQEEVIEELTNSDINIVPSVVSRDGDMEGIPVGIMESMAIGIPVISTYHSGIPEIIEDGVTGFLVKEKNSEEIKRKIELILNNPSSIEVISNNARNKVESEYNIKYLTQNLEEIFSGKL